MLVLGVVAAVLSGGNLLVLGLAGLLILFGVVTAVVAEIAGWLQAHGIFRPPKTYGGLTYTQRGEAVRSNSERTIADYFHRNRPVAGSPRAGRVDLRRLQRGRADLRRRLPGSR